MPTTRPKNEKIIALFFLGLLGFNYPLLALFSRNSLTFGIPSLYLYLFVLWTLFIGFIALLLEKNSPPPPPLAGKKSTRPSGK